MRRMWRREGCFILSRPLLRSRLDHSFHDEGRGGGRREGRAREERVREGREGRGRKGEGGER